MQTHPNHHRVQWSMSRKAFWPRDKTMRKHFPDSAPPGKSLYTYQMYLYLYICDEFHWVTSNTSLWPNEMANFSKNSWASWTRTETGRGLPRREMLLRKSSARLVDDKHTHSFNLDMFLQNTPSSTRPSSFWCG